jgi:carboxyl-terminal processing protease
MSHRWSSLVALCALFSCCGPAAILAGDLDYDRDLGMFADGLEEIDQHYVRAVELNLMVADGLAGLDQIDPGISVRMAAGQLEVTDGAGLVATLPVSGRLGPEDGARLMARALRAVRRASPAIKAVDSEAAYQAIFDGMLNSLDPPFSRYTGRTAATQDRAGRLGYVGIGVHISVEDSGTRIKSVIPDTPAERAGLSAEDVILAIDGRSTQGLDQASVVDMLRGAEGSQVTLTIRPSTGAATRTLGLIRAPVAPDTVQYRREGDIAYFRIVQFGVGTADGVRHGLEQARSDGGTLRGIILDLRGNPGGLLDQGIAVVDLFTSRGRILTIRGRDPRADEAFNATGRNLGGALPIAVLISGSSASASEIVAAALQDSDRAVVIGSSSYGKGTVQGVHPMPNGGELILTVARFYAPSGYTLQHLGVLPTICTSGGQGDASTFLADLAADKIPRLPIEKRNRASPDDAASLDQLKAECPASRAIEPLDVDLASRLLEDPGLYARAIALADPGTKALQ